MDVFNIGLIVLGAMTVVFYIVIFSFFFYWHLKKISFIVVPIIFTFEFLIMGFFVVSIVSIIINYLPVVVRVAGI